MPPRSSCLETYLSRRCCCSAFPLTWPLDNVDTHIPAYLRMHGRLIPGEGNAKSLHHRWRATFPSAFSPFSLLLCFLFSLSSERKPCSCASLAGWNVLGRWLRLSREVWSEFDCQVTGGSEFIWSVSRSEFRGWPLRDAAQKYGCRTRRIKLVRSKSRGSIETSEK